MTVLLHPAHVDARPLPSTTPLDPARTQVFRAPDRFDVHQVPAFEAWLSGRQGRVVIDGSNVKFIDQAALEAVEAALDHPTVHVRLGGLSTAMSITIELVDRARRTLPGHARPHGASAGARLEVAA